MLMNIHFIDLHYIDRQEKYNIDRTKDKLK